MSSIFDLPSEASPGPNVINARFERINPTTPIAGVHGSTHNFRMEPSGTDWWLPNKSYFRTKLKIVVGFNESRFPPWKPDGQNGTEIKTVKQPTSWPLPSQTSNTYVDGTDPGPTGYARSTTGYKYSVLPFDDDGKVANAQYNFNTGMAGYSLQRPVYLRDSTIQEPSDADVEGQLSTDCLGPNNPETSAFYFGNTAAGGIGYIGHFKPFTCLKFLEIADCAVDAFFDQMSFSIGPVRIESVTHCQLVNTMRKRATASPLIGATRFDSMGVFSDEQYPHTRDRNVASGKTSVFDVLGYDNIRITSNFDWQTEYTVEFDVIYVPPLSIFEQPHAMPPARYDIEFKGVSTSQLANNNFFHCTLPGGTGRWNVEYGTQDSAGRLNQAGPATAFDGKHAQGRQSGFVSQHAPGSIFVFEPPVGAGCRFNPQSIENHVLGRGVATTSRLRTPISRLDPGCFVSVQIVSMHLEAAMVTGPVQNDSAFVLQFDQLTPQLIQLGDSTAQNIIFDVDPFANFFMFGFRQTDTNKDVCLQEGHLVCPGNTERDLKEYYINFDMKTRPVNFATEINLYNIRGATNELIRTQMNQMTLYSAVPETIRTWLKKGPFYAYDWPRDGTANATRFQINLTFHDKTNKYMEGSMGPHGMFENERPLVHCQLEHGFQDATYDVDDDSKWGASNSTVSEKSDCYYLADSVLTAVPTKMNDEEGARYGLATFVPNTYWSLYYPCSRSLMYTQSRVDASDYANYDVIKTNYTTSTIPSTDVRVVTQLTNTKTEALATTFGSVTEVDQGYKGTEHSRPNNCHLASALNSIILFQNIPRKYVIMTSSGRVVGVRTVDNRT